MEAPARIDVDYSSPNALLIRLEGEFDISESDRLKKCFESAVTAGLLVLDFEKTTYIDSSVLHVLCGLQAAVESRGARLVLVGLSSSLRRIFEVMRLDAVFDLRGVADLKSLGIGDGEMRTLTISPS